MSASIRIRAAEPFDLEQLNQIETACFPPAEAASKEQLQQRLSVYPNHFLVLEKEAQLLGMINGAVVDQADLIDEMYEKPSYHNDESKHQMIFGIAVLPAYQHQGIAQKLMKAFIEQAKNENRDDLVLTCKKHLIPFYERFGFEKEGISSSSHGKAEWYQMRKKL